MKLLFTEENERKLEIIKEGIFESLDGPKDLRERIKSLLSRNSDERIAYREMKKLPFLKEYFKAYEKRILLEFLPSETQE